MNDFIRPVGSVDETVENTSNVTAVGNGFFPRHALQSSQDNPLVPQLALARKKADQDWLYELAVKWEVDRANLEEQRAYDDPRARIARERQAGIDSTLSGSAGAGSAGGSSSVMPATQASTKPFNYYDNANLALQGVSLGFQGLGTLINGASQVMELVKGISTFSDFISQSKSATTIASQTATQSVQQTDSNKLSLDSQRMSNQTQRYIQAGDIASLFPEGLTSDEDWNNHLDIFGVKEEQMRKLIRHIATSPEARARYNEMIKEARQGEAFNFANTVDILRSIDSNASATALNQSEIAFQQSLFERDLAYSKYSPENLEKAKTIVDNDFSTSLIESNKRKDIAKENWKSWRSSMSLQSQAIDLIDLQISSLKDKKESGEIKDNTVYRARLNSLYVQRLQMQTMLDKQAFQMANFLQQKYHSDFLDSLARNGDFIIPGWSVLSSPHSNWSQTQFNFTGSISSDDGLDQMENVAMKLIDILL